MKQRVIAINAKNSASEIARAATENKEIGERISSIALSCASATYFCAVVVYEQDGGAE